MSKLTKQKIREIADKVKSQNPQISCYIVNGKEYYKVQDLLDLNDRIKRTHK